MGRTEQLEVFFRVNWLENQSYFTIYRGNDISTGVNILAVEKRIKNRHIKTHKLKFWVFKNKMRNSQSCVRSVTIWPLSLSNWEERLIMRNHCPPCFISLEKGCFYFDTYYGSLSNFLP